MCIEINWTNEIESRISFTRDPLAKSGGEHMLIAHHVNDLFFISPHINYSFIRSKYANAQKLYCIRQLVLKHKLILIQLNMR